MLEDDGDLHGEDNGGLDTDLYSFQDFAVLHFYPHSWRRESCEILQVPLLPYKQSSQVMAARDIHSHMSDCIDAVVKGYKKRAYEATLAMLSIAMIHRINDEVYSQAMMRVMVERNVQKEKTARASASLHVLLLSECKRNGDVPYKTSKDGYTQLLHDALQALSITKDVGSRIDIPSVEEVLMLLGLCIQSLEVMVVFEDQTHIRCGLRPHVKGYELRESVTKQRGITQSSGLFCMMGPQHALLSLREPVLWAFDRPRKVTPWVSAPTANVATATMQMSSPGNMPHDPSAPPCSSSVGCSPIWTQLLSCCGIREVERCPAVPLQSDDKETSIRQEAHKIAQRDLKEYMWSLKDGDTTPSSICATLADCSRGCSKCNDEQDADHLPLLIGSFLHIHVFYINGCVYDSVSVELQFIQARRKLAHVLKAQAYRFSAYHDSDGVESDQAITTAAFETLLGILLLIDHGRYPALEPDRAQQLTSDLIDNIMGNVCMGVREEPTPVSPLRAAEANGNAGLVDRSVYCKDYWLYLERSPNSETSSLQSQLHDRECYLNTSRVRRAWANLDINITSQSAARCAFLDGLRQLDVLSGEHFDVDCRMREWQGLHYMKPSYFSRLVCHNGDGGDSCDMDITPLIRDIHLSDSDVSLHMRLRQRAITFTHVITQESHYISYERLVSFQHDGFRTLHIVVRINHSPEELKLYDESYSGTRPRHLHLTVHCKTTAEAHHAELLMEYFVAAWSLPVGLTPHLQCGPTRRAQRWQAMQLRDHDGTCQARSGGSESPMMHALRYIEKEETTRSERCMGRHISDIGSHSPPSSSSLMLKEHEPRAHGRDTFDDYEDDDAVLEMAVLESQLEQHLVA